MNNLERKRLNYRPQLVMERNIEAFYINNGLIINKKNTLDPKLKEDNISEAIKAHNQFNIIDIYDYSILLKENIEKKIKKTNNKVLKLEKYDGLIKALEDKDYKTIKSFDEIFDNYNADIKVEVLPIYYYLKENIENQIDYINNNLINELKDIKSIDKKREAIEQYKNDLISAEANEKDNFIDYKVVSMNTQVYNLLQERLLWVYETYDQITKIAEKVDVELVIDSNDQGLLTSEYDDIIKVVKDSKLKLDMFKSSNAYENILSDMQKSKSSVIQNRNKLVNADKSTFLGIIPHVRTAENKFDNSILDLYKANKAELIAFYNYLNKLNYKQDLRLLFSL
jgi:hypothetical protein